MKKWDILPIFLLVLWIFATGCSSTTMIPVEKVKTGKTVKVYLKNQTSVDGVLLEKSERDLLVLELEGKKEMAIPLETVRRIDYLDRYYDYSGEEISLAEIRKFKENTYFVGYTVGGFFLGGLSGIVVSLPLWYTETGVKPLFVGGITAIGGAIYFGQKGNQRDEERAVELIRLFRQRKSELHRKQQQELEELERLKEEKQKLELEKEKQEKQRRMP